MPFRRSSLRETQPAVEDAAAGCETHGRGLVPGALPPQTAALPLSLTCVCMWIYPRVSVLVRDVTGGRRLSLTVRCGAENKGPSERGPPEAAEDVAPIGMDDKRQAMGGGSSQGECAIGVRTATILFLLLLLLSTPPPAALISFSFCSFSISFPLSSSFSPPPFPARSTRCFRISLSLSLVVPRLAHTHSPSYSFSH